MVLMCAPSIGDPEKSELVLVTPAGKQRLTRALVQGDHAVRMLNAADVGNPVAPLKPDMASSPAPPPPFSEVLSKAGNRALGGGVPGAVAMVAQVTGLMWLHTTLKYQYCHGTTTMATFRHLYAEGGVLRFYKGYLPALVQGPAIKFSQTASNAGMLAMLDSYDSTRGLPTGLKTMSASAVAASFRLLLMPIDTLKTMMQVEGRHGVPALITKCRASGPSVLFHGALAASGSTFVAHFTWFYTHNLLDDAIPKHCASHALHRMARNAAIGFCASLVSDVTSNSIRVIKTTKQASETALTYRGAVLAIMARDGLHGLFFRGLSTRIMANAVQGMLFTIMWKGLEERWRAAESGRAAAKVGPAA